MTNKQKINAWDISFFNKEEQKNTPERIKRFHEELASKREFTFTCFDNEQGYNDIILLRNIRFSSFCSHHDLQFSGVVHVGYIPKKDGKICGISKLARAVDKFAAQPQIQERMTHQIAEFIVEQLQPDGVMVVLIASHTCMTERGVRKYGAEMVTSAIRGIFRDEPATVSEFLRLIQLNSEV